MCGINGILGKGDYQQKVSGMNAALSHRGPNDEGVWQSDQIALGHKRLSIIDLSADGHQPMQDATGRYTIVYNGELYNYQDLRPELEVTTNTDTEVILKAYIKWGADCLPRFNGMFAFAIWDQEEQTLFIARDRLGIKPLYYYQEGDTFVFSSELRALLSSGLVPKKLDETALVDYLRYQTVHAPRTMIDQVRMLMPGHSMRIKGEEVMIEQYWSVETEQRTANNYQEVAKEVKNLFFQAVNKRLIADVPFGAFLSGGIDSSAVVAAMSEVSSQQVKTFSVTFDEQEFSEAKYAQLIADKFKTDHHEIKLKVDDFLTALPDALQAMDHPSGDGPNTYVVSKATKEAGITVALSGLGGDELFAGYAVFQRNLSLKSKAWLQLFPQFSRKALGNLLQTVRPGIASDKLAAWLEQQKVNYETYYPLSRQVLLDAQLKNILSYTDLPANEVEQIIQGIATEQTISKTSMAELSTYLQNVLLRDTDQMSMAHALEVRVPFLDHELVEYVLSLPDQYKVPTTPKKLLTDALGDLLPREIIDRPKMGFTFPWKHWMKNELKSFCEERIHSLAARTQFNEPALLQLWQDFLNDAPQVSWSRLWYLVVLENWLMTHQIES